MKEWFTPAEIIAARSPDLPGTLRDLNKLAAAGWRSDPRKAKPAKGKGGGWLYHLSCLPPGAQARLTMLHRPAPMPAPEPSRDDASQLLWSRFEALPEAHKAECRRRLTAIDALSHAIELGASAGAAASAIAADAGISVATLYNWRKLAASAAEADRLAALAPNYRPTSSHADCHPAALDALKTDYLRASKPCFSACYRRIRKLASKNGWLPFPSERSLRRRIEAEVPKAVQILAREGAKKAKTLYPAQQRTRLTLHAMQAVNMDGHRLDVFVRLQDGSIGRMHLLALQDLYSGKIVSYRLSETENKETVRLVIGDMVSTCGIPEKILLDNGRAFASKWISGGIDNRYRFKVKPGDPQGLLTTLGVEIVWAKPYSGQSKPIERCFRDLAEAIAKHPTCEGAYTGNRPEAKPENYGSRAITLDVLRELVAQEIADHNARPGRRLETCAGRSFNETFAASMAERSTIVRWPAPAQRALWLMAAEAVRSQKGSGEIHLEGNRYWAPALNAYAGQKVVVRFDPDRLHETILVYTADDRLIGEAPCIAKTGFFDQDAARTHARDRGAYEKALREQRRIQSKMSVDELSRLLAHTEATPAPAPAPAVKKIAVAGGQAAPTMPDTDFEDAFSRGLAGLGGEIVPFAPRRAG